MQDTRKRVRLSRQDMKDLRAVLKRNCLIPEALLKDRDIEGGLAFERLFNRYFDLVSELTGQVKSSMKPYTVRRNIDRGYIRFKDKDFKEEILSLLPKHPTL